MYINYENEKNEKASMIIGEKIYIRMNNQIIECETEESAEEKLNIEGFYAK